ncbi:MAG: methionyl-tRNA formyltransferase [Candidatus Kaiserbacteria bacterium]|nr:MAG: methionyl-tRNA formyltransferase [Candidatus Kaiserbacteria bacterium]
MTKNPKSKSEIRYVFFGVPDLSVRVLEELSAAHLLPALVVTAPDEKTGRGLQLTPPPVKRWAVAHKIPVLQPHKIDANFLSELGATKWDVFVVVAFGKILPSSVLEMPRRGVLNVHPSLLPRLRGASPIRSAILNDEKKTGVTVMLLDEEMDHGPIIAQKAISPIEWPPGALQLERQLMSAGGKLLAQVLPLWCADTIEARPQNHDIATYSEKIEKNDGLLDVNDDPRTNILKIRAYEGWPGTHAFFTRGSKKIRVQILQAHTEGGRLVIDTVKPEGKNEMRYDEFLRSGAKPA